MHFQTCSYLSETRFAYAKPKGDKGFVLQAVQCLARKHHVARTDRTLRIDYGRPEWNNLGEGIVSGTELQVSPVQVLRAFTCEQRFFIVE
jgi:hypothetical protein